MKTIEKIKIFCEALEKTINHDFIESGLVTLNAEIEKSRYPLRLLSEEHVTKEARERALVEIENVGKKAFDSTIAYVGFAAKQIGMLNFLSAKVYDESKSDYVQTGEMVKRLGKMCAPLNEKLHFYIKKSMDFICGTTSFCTRNEFKSSVHEAFNKSWLTGRDEMGKIFQSL